MKTSLSLLAWPPAVILVVASFGCATPALWRETAACVWQPTGPDEVCLVTTTNETRDIAVFFSQRCPTKDSAKPRPALWCLSQTVSNLVVGAKAIRAVTSSWTSAQPLQLASPAEPAAAPSYSVDLSKNPQVTVRVDGFPPGPYELPATYEKTRTATRWISLPFAVAGDAAVLSAAVLAAGAVGCATDLH